MRMQMGMAMRIEIAARRAWKNDGFIERKEYGRSSTDVKTTVDNETPAPSRMSPGRSRRSTSETAARALEGRYQVKRETNCTTRDVLAPVRAVTSYAVDVAPRPPTGT